MASRPAAAGAGAAPGRSAPQTDVRKRTVLPSTLQNMRGAGGGGQGGAGQGDLSSDEYLDRQEEELNRRVDVHVDQLVHGMQDLVGLAKVSQPRFPRSFWQA